MAITYEEVRRRLDVDEPDYIELQELGADALPHLSFLAVAADEMLASKATFLAGIIPADGAAEVVAEAVTSPHPAVRVAAASTAANLPSEASTEILRILLGDGDAGVRKAAIKSAVTQGTPELLARVRQLSETDDEPWVRELATKTLSNVGP